MARSHEKTPDWPYELYIRNASTYMPVLESGLAKAPVEARGLARIFSRFQVPNHGRILDVSCGIGRHDVQLARLGYKVVGYDPSATFLERARKLAKRMKLAENRLGFYQGGIQEIARVLRAKREDPFDAITSMDYSFGYKTVKDDLNLFRSLHELGSEDSVLVVDTGSRDYWSRHFQKYWIQSFPHNLVRLAVAHLDLKKSRLTGDWEFYRRLKDASLKHLLSVRVTTILYSKQDLTRLLLKAGWKHQASYGSVENLERWSRDSFQTVIVARKSSQPL